MRQIPTRLGAILAAAFFVLLASSGCSHYRLGTTFRSLPGGYKEISIPVFKNHTLETGIEMYFTNSLIGEFTRSNLAKVVDDNKSDVKLVGDIESLRYEPLGPIISNPSYNYLPKNTVLASVYNTMIAVKLQLVRKSDGKELWSGSFASERSYSAPHVLLSGVNSVNPLYNLSARRQNIESISFDMMAEAYDRLTENF